MKADMNERDRCWILDGTQIKFKHLWVGTLLFVLNSWRARSLV
jgi:hypothetical protein